MKFMEKKPSFSMNTEEGLKMAGECLLKLFYEVFEHDGYGNLDVSIRFMKRGQKEILMRCGKEYRFVVDYKAPSGKES